MKISYKSSKLEKILTNERLIKKEFGKLATKIINRLSELRAANDLSEISHLPPPRRHKLEDQYEESWGLDVGRNFRIIVTPDGGWSEADLSTVTSIIILAIEDYH